MKTINKHAPLRSRRIRNRKSPWITKDLRRQIFNRDYLKKKAVTSNDRQARNHINNEIKKKLNKLIYYKNNVELNKGNMKKTWNLINELSSRNVSKTKRITQLDFEE